MTNQHQENDELREYEIKVYAPAFSDFYEKMYLRSPGLRQVWGYIPTFLSLNNPEGAVYQFAANYGSWMSSDRATLEFLGPDTDHVAVMRYPGDPDLLEIDRFKFRHEIVIIFPHAFVAVVDPDLGTYSISRLD